MKKLAPERKNELFDLESVEMFRPKLDKDGKQVYRTTKIKGKDVQIKVREKYIVYEKNSIQVIRKELGMGESKINIRNCLSCAEKFESEGKHNRLCLECAGFRGLI